MGIKYQSSVNYRGVGGIDTAEIAAAVLAAAQVTPIQSDVRKMNNAPVVGTGKEADLWRGVE